MPQNPCHDMLSGESNIVKFCKKQQAPTKFNQFEIVRAIYDSGMLSNDNLSPATKLVLIALAHHYNPKNEDMFPSQKYLAQKLGISERSAERAVAELKNANLITYETKRVNRYKFTAKFFESVKLSDDNRQTVGNNPRQIVGQTNNHEHKNNITQKQNFYSNQPKGIDYQDLQPFEHKRDERTPENDLKTAKHFVQELLPMAQNPVIKVRLEKIFKIWGEENFMAKKQEIPPKTNHYLIF